MDAIKIKAIMKEKNVKQADIAKSLKIRESTVSQVINGKFASRRIMKAVARRCGITLAEIAS